MSSRLLVKYCRDEGGIAELKSLISDVSNTEYNIAPVVYYGIALLMSGRTLGDAMAGLREKSTFIRLIAWIVVHASSEHLFGKELSSIVTKAHLGMFFLGSKYYSLADRLLRVQRELVGEAPSGLSATAMRLIGMSLLVHAASEALGMYRAKERQKHLEHAWEEIAGDTKQSASIGHAPQCQICLNSSQSPTACLCGHVFCWSCVSVWFAHKEQRCSVCRAPCTPQQLVPLNHYAVIRGEVKLPWTTK